MSYVIYNIESTYILNQKIYKTEAAAKAGLTRASKQWKDKSIDAQYAIAETRNFRENIEKQVTRKNLMTGKEFTQPANTPRCCDPSSELYWSM